MAVGQAPNQTLDPNILRQGDSRIFVQTLGINARNPYDYYGCMMLEDVEQDLGDVESVYCPDPNQRNAWVIVDEIVGTQSMGSTSFQTQARRDGADAIRELKDRRCLTNWQVVRSRCARPDDFSEWDSKLVLRNTRLTSFTQAGGNPLSGDDNAVSQLSGDLSFWESYVLKKINFGEQADATALAEILDGLFNDNVQCGDCGPASDGCNKAYFLAKANTGSPGLAAQIVFTLNGTTWSTRDVSAITTGASKIAVMGNFLLVFTTTTPGHKYIALADLNAGTGSWATITSGYVEEPRAVWVKGANEAYLACDLGYIHKLTGANKAATTVTDGSVTTQNLAAIHGRGNTIVAVGASNAVIVSRNGGRTFSAVTGPAVGVALTACWVVNDYQWFVGTGTGLLYYTDDGGVSWVNMGVDSDITSINDIEFYDETTGYMAVTQGVRGRVYRTTTGGYEWLYTAPHLNGLVANTRMNCVAVCGPNKVAAGGLALDGSDGIIAIAS